MEKDLLPVYKIFYDPITRRTRLPEPDKFYNVSFLKGGSLISYLHNDKDPEFVSEGSVLTTSGWKKK